MKWQDDGTERDGVASCEALPGYMIGGTEENHALIQLIQAVSGPKFQTRSLPNTSCNFCAGETGSKIVAVTSLGAASVEAS